VWISSPLHVWDHTCSASEKDEYREYKVTAREIYQKANASLKWEACSGFWHYNLRLVRCARHCAHRELGGNSSIRFNVHIHDRSSTSNCSVAFRGMTGGEPSSPYASSGGMVKTTFSWFFIVLMPKSHPFITCPIGSNNIVYFRNMHHFTTVYTLSKLRLIILQKENTHVTYNFIVVDQ
jgi:hypothetical protein